MKKDKEDWKKPKRIIIVDDKRKFDALKMMNKGLTAGENKEEDKVFDEIKELQKEFQEKYCPKCIAYDPIKKDFIYKGNDRDLEGCKHHFTDILGSCWNYYKREE